MKERFELDIADGVYAERDATHTQWNCPGNGWLTHDCVGYGDEAAYVRIISKHRGGQIRGYVQHNGRLLLQGPDYCGQWPELDSSVERALGIPVAPYNVLPGGAVELQPE